MSEIEKMYENAKIEKYPHCCDITCGEPTIKCKDCPDYIEIYPPFTAEKQLELIKWISSIDEEIRISGHRKGTLYWMSTNVDNKKQASTFEETLAKLVNTIWQDLTEDEKQQVKGILE